MVENPNLTVVLLRLAALMSLGLAFWNHLLPPLHYAMTQYLFDYEEGFMRRGLVGALLNLFWTPPVTLFALYRVAFAITATGAIAVFLFLATWLRSGLAANMLVLIAVNSFAFASFIGFVGYYDAVLAALAVCALMCPATGAVGIILRSALIVTGALVHEAMVPYFAVLIAFDSWISTRGAARWQAGVPLVVGAVAAAVLLFVVELPPEAQARLTASIVEHMPIPTHTEALNTVGMSLADHGSNFAVVRQSLLYDRMMLYDGLPLALMSLWLLWLARGLLDAEPDSVTRLLLAGVVLAPLTVNVVAIDVARFGAASVLAGFMMIAVILRRVEGAGERLDRRLGLGMAVIVLVINANMFTMTASQNMGHTAQAPWVTVPHLDWTKERSK